MKRWILFLVILPAVFIWVVMDEIFFTIKNIRRKKPKQEKRKEE